MDYSAAERFWPKVIQSSTHKCWLWKGAKSKNNEGRFRYGGSTWNASRVSWLLHNGPIPKVFTFFINVITLLALILITCFLEVKKTTLETWLKRGVTGSSRLRTVRKVIHMTMQTRSFIKVVGTAEFANMRESYVVLRDFGLRKGSWFWIS